MSNRVLPFTGTTRTTSTPDTTTPATVYRPTFRRPTPDAPIEVNRLSRIAETMFAAAAIAEICPELELADCVVEAEMMLADRSAGEETSHIELVEMVRALFPGAGRRH